MGAGKVARAGRKGGGGGGAVNISHHAASRPVSVLVPLPHEVRVRVGFVVTLASHCAGARPGVAPRGVAAAPSGRRISCFF